MATQEYVNQLVREAAQQAGGTLSYADAMNAAANLGIPASQIQAALSTGVITGAPAAAPAPVQLPTGYDQAYVNQLVQEAAQQAGGTLSYADALNAAQNLGIPVSMINAAAAGGAVTGAPTATQPPPRTPTPTPATPTMPKGYDQNYVNQLLREAAQQAGGTLSYADALRAAQNLGIPQNMLNTAMRTGMITESVTPFANATQGMQQNTRGTYTSIPIGVQSFGQNFQNYMNTPLGAQYNPGVTGGVSPYSAIMNQMQPFQNPYAGVMANQPIGGYNPNIYDAGLYDRVVQERADKAAADAAAATAQQQAMDYGAFDGGLITKVMGPKPDTPDDGTMFVQKGEYIVKKDAVNKYGKGLLDKVNEGKIPASKMKSLLG